MENKIIKEHEEYVASSAINWMDDLPKRIEMLILQGAYEYDLSITKKETARAMSIIEEALSDLFHRDRCRKVTICGEPIDRLSVLSRLPNEAMKGFSVRKEAGLCDTE